MNDLFLTVTDQKTGKSYYEIYIRKEIDELARQTSESEDIQDPLSGLNSYCLIASEEIPAGGMFNFADVDRDGMFDMIYLPETEFGLTIYYNKLSTNYDNRFSRVDTSSDNF